MTKEKNDKSQISTGTVIRNVRVFDGEKLIKADTVLMRDGVITDIGNNINVPANFEIVDGHGGTLLPGLIDCHVHVAPVNLEQALAFGVTTEMDMANEPKVVELLRMAAANRHDVADIRSASRAACAPGTGLAKIIKDLPTVSGPEDARSFVDARITEDADYIKIILDPGGTPCLFSFETIQALIDAAHSHNKRVFAHVEKGEAARLFIEAGGDVLAHVLNDLKPDSNFIDKLIQNKVFVIPTLRVSALYTAEGKEGRQKLLDHPLFNPYLDPQTRQILSQDTGNIISRFDFEGAKRTTKALHEAGVPILAGTDATPGIPVQQNVMSNLAGHGIPLHQELELLVQAGLTPSEALASATSVPAHCFGLSDRGRITRGLRADLLLVNGDPTHDIKVSREIIAIWRSGFRFDREAYRKRIESK